MDKVDLPQVTLIEQHCQSHPWSLLQFLEGFDAGHAGWVVCHDEADRESIIGFAIVSTVLDESSLLNICVSPDFQNRGIGRYLLDFLLDKARTQGMLTCFLEVRASNKKAMALYESAGFQQVSRRADYYPLLIGREDGLVYSLSLSPAEQSPEEQSPEE
jgi:ribosomal-protein-alanine N-acetyltransferase